jgi:hypothetical protein
MFLNDCFSERQPGTLSSVCIGPFPANPSLNSQLFANVTAAMPIKKAFCFESTDTDG